jgi:hypothetical protein
MATHLLSRLDLEALADTPRDVLRRAEHELANAITGPALLELDVSREMAVLDRIRAELRRRDEVARATFAFLHRPSRAEVIA